MQPFLGFFDEHLFAWSKHMYDLGYCVSGYAYSCYGGRIVERNFGSSVCNPEIVIRYED